MANLLVNPGFEGVETPGEWTRATFSGQEFGEIFTPRGWIAFWKEGGPVPHDPNNGNGYGRPECKVIPRRPPFLEPARIHEGEWAWQCFTFYRIHDAGLYQQVSGVVPGRRLRARAWAHAWSSQNDDASGSDVDGGGEWNFTFHVGLDPLGGTDPWGDGVVWSEPVHYYDAYQQLPPVEAVAQAESVTLFLRSTVLWPFKHCDAYWDAATLELVDEEAPPSGDVEIALPSRLYTRDVLRLTVRGGAARMPLALTFEGGEVLRGDPHEAGEDVYWRWMAPEAGPRIARVLDAHGEVVAERNFTVTRGPSPRYLHTEPT